MCNQSGIAEIKLLPLYIRGRGVFFYLKLAGRQIIIKKLNKKIYKNLGGMA